MFVRPKANAAVNLLGELVMIVVGINIALWFEGWFDDLQDEKTEQQYLAGLSDDLMVDIKSLTSTISDNKNKLDELSATLPTLPTLMEAPSEQQSAAFFAPSSYYFFQPSDFTYRSMQESGDFRLLSDENVKRELLRLIRRYRQIELLQANFIQALDDGYIPLLMSGFDILEGRVVDPESIDQLLLRNFFAFSIQDISGRLNAYSKAATQAQELLDLINAGLK